jgi:hypothetical protein
MPLNKYRSTTRRSLLATGATLPRADNRERPRDPRPGSFVAGLGLFRRRARQGAPPGAREGRGPSAEARAPGLYDLSTDPGETRNLAREQPELARRLKDRLALLADVIAQEQPLPR